MSLLKSRSAQILTVVLLLQAFGFYSLSLAESVPPVKELNQLPAQFGEWRMVQEGVVEKEVADVLKADDLLTRNYAQKGSYPDANLFIAFFRSQRTGRAPHSPRNCLPGSGWVPLIDQNIDIQIPGEAQPRTMNRYIVQKGDDRSLVIYWYQSRDRVVASEYWAKYYVITDALRLNRTDTSLIRVVIPVVQNDVDGATRKAVHFIQSFFPTVRDHLPA